MDRINVLDKGWVELVDSMPAGRSGDAAIVEAARISFKGESKGPEKDKKLLFYLYKHKHMSPFEQVEMKFMVYMPVVAWWHILRHRTLKPNLQSGRYTPFEENDFYLPDVWRLQSADNKQGSAGQVDDETAKKINESLKEHCETSYKCYAELLGMGIAKEQARIFLPAFSLYYKGIVSGNARNFMNFFSQRMKSDAQFEISEYAKAMFSIFKEVLPWTAEAFETIQ